MPSFIKRLSLRNSFQQRQSIHQDRRRTIRAIPFFQDFKIAIIGDESVGKSNIAMRCAGKETFVAEHEPTIEDEYNCKIQFTFRLPTPLSVVESVSNNSEGDSNELIRNNPKGDIYGYKQMAHDLEIIPQELRDYMKLDDTLHSIIQQKREKQEEMKKSLEEKNKRKFSLFKKKSITDSSQKSNHESLTNHVTTLEGEFGRHVTEEGDEDEDYIDELLSDVIYNFEQEIICRVTIVDTSGRSEIRKEATDLSSMDGYMLVFDMNNKASFAKIQQYIDECRCSYFENPVRKHLVDASLSHSSSSTRLSISSVSGNSSTTGNSSSNNNGSYNGGNVVATENPPMVLLMNKCDQKPSALKTINAEYGYALGDTHHFPFYVVSACENLNIQESIEALLSEIIKKNIEEGVYETQNKPLAAVPQATDENSSKTASRNFKFENQNISISSNATDYTPELVTFSVGNGTLIPQGTPEKKIVRQSVSATLRKYVVQQFKKK